MTNTEYKDWLKKLSEELKTISNLLKSGVMDGKDVSETILNISKSVQIISENVNE